MSTLAIVGAGISGLLTAYHALSNNTISQVTLLEQKSKIPRKHCSGIISPETLLALPYGLRYIENKYRGIEFYILPSIRILLKCTNVIAYKIDRVSHEKELYRQIVMKGVDVQLNKRVLEVGIRENYSLLIHDTITKTLTRKEFDYIIISEGYPHKLSLDANLDMVIRPLYGLQQDVIYSSENIDMETLYVFIDPAIFGEGFGWFIPVTEDKGIIGLAHSRKHIELFSIFRKVVSKTLKMNISSIIDVYGGRVLQGYPKTICNNSICALGDAIGMVKSISGGGLYAITKMSRVYAKNIGISDIAKQKEVREMLSELRIQYILKYFLWKIISMLKNIVSSNSRYFIEIDVSYLDYDRHDKLLLDLIKYLTQFKLGAMDCRYYL